MAGTGDGKVLVAGATGLIGSHVVKELLARGAQVRGTLHERPAAVQDPRIEYVSADLTRREECDAAVRGVEQVYLCAANTSGAAVMVNNPVAHITANLLINSQMLEAAVVAGVRRFLFISSSSVYPPGDRPVREEEGFDGDPHDAYFGVGWMKRYTEKLAAFYQQRYGLKVTIIRPTNTYGPMDDFDPERSHVLPALIRRAVAGEEPFLVWGDGTAVRDFIYVEDLAAALVEAMERGVEGQALNVGTGRTVTIGECVAIILRLVGRPDAQVVYDTTKPSTIPFREVDLRRCHELLGRVAPVGLEEGLRRTVEWYRESVGVA